MNHKIITLFFLTFLSLNCFSQKKKLNAELEFTAGVYSITEVMYHDVVNPPAAARFYAYSTLAAYQVVSENNTEYPALAIVLSSYTPQPSRINKSSIDVSFCAIYAMLETARNMIPSGLSLDEKQEMLYQKYSKTINKSILDSSVVYAIAVAKSVIKYAKSDGYLKLSTLPRYQPKESDSTWYPTPPEYMPAVEPHWNSIRTFFLDSAGQFKPKPPEAFSKDATTPFGKLNQEVYLTAKNLTAEQKLIAQFWDCNPFANFYSGHVSIAIKKISPGGHWMNIAGIACSKAKLPFEKVVQIHVWIAMGLHDSFISCWTEKYRSERLRPKTSVNRYIDEKWNPLIETPPFPEYPSGHSVISTTSAELLTYFLGDNFSFTDNTEVFFNLPERNFKSFRQAANEAAISRLYGGIHYRDAIENGQGLGNEIGSYIITKLKRLKR